MTLQKFAQEVFQGKWIDPSASAGKSTKPAAGADPLAIDGIDCIEIYVYNAKQSAFFFSQAFGFEPIAYRGPETGFRDSVSYVLKQGVVHLVITAPLRPTLLMAADVMIHGMTVKNVALQVPDCESFYYEAMKRGAISAEVPTRWEDEDGYVKRAGIRTYGDTIHSLVERSHYKGVFWPGFIPYEDLFPPMPKGASPGIVAIDHVVGNVALGDMQRWVSFYEKILGFKEMMHFSDDQISTEYSALMSKVVRDGSGRVKFPINEPAQGKRKSQIDEYLDFHAGPGVQHIAMVTTDIIRTVSELKSRGIQFLRVPLTYYEEISKRVGPIKQDLQKIAELGILVDRDDDGYLLQLFTKPVDDRPTLFFEIIQREGSQGFGVGNFKALFEAVERDQAQRGNL